MIEVLPVLGGIVLLFLSCVLRPLSGVSLIFAGFVIGAFCSLLTGELSSSWMYAVVDSLEVIGVCKVTPVVLSWLVRMLRSAATV